MLQLVIALSVLEGVIVITVLALYLVSILRSLRKSVSFAAKIAFGVRAIETQVGSVGPSVTSLNRTLSEIAAALPRVAEKAERTRGGG